jgi:hypothetical protein
MPLIWRHWARDDLLRQALAPNRIKSTATKGCVGLRNDDAPVVLLPSLCCQLGIRFNQAAKLPQQCLNLMPEPHGHGSLRPTLP